MPKYLFEASYTAEGAKGLLKDGGSGRRTAVEQLVQGLGSKVEAVCFSFGDVDASVIADVSAAVSAVAGSLAANTTGVMHVKPTVLSTSEETDQAVQKTIKLRAPGG